MGGLAAGRLEVLGDEAKVAEGSSGGEEGILHDQACRQAGEVREPPTADGFEKGGDGGGAASGGAGGATHWYEPALAGTRGSVPVRAWGQPTLPSRYWVCT